MQQGFQKRIVFLQSILFSNGRFLQVSSPQRRRQCGSPPLQGLSEDFRKDAGIYQVTFGLEHSCFH